MPHNHVFFKLTHSAYLRMLEDSWVKVRKRLKVTTYLPEPLIEALFHEDISNNDYVLCPHYTDGCTQIGITGTGADNESDRTSMIREMGEEIGLKPEHAYDLKRITRKEYFTPKGKILISVYIADMDHLVPLECEEHSLDVANGKDNRTRKVGCIVYGSKAEILDGYLMSEYIHRYYSEDNISGVLAMRVSDARAFVSTSSKSYP